MNKKELIKSMSEVSGLNQTDSEAAFNALIHCRTDLLAKGDAIWLCQPIGEGQARTYGKKPCHRNPVEHPS